MPLTPPPSPPSSPAPSQNNRNPGPDATIRARPLSKKSRSGNRSSYAPYNPAAATPGNSQPQPTPFQPLRSQRLETSKDRLEPAQTCFAPESPATPRTE